MTHDLAPRRDSYVIFENNGFEDRIVIHFQPKNEMKILIKMV